MLPLWIIDLREKSDRRDLFERLLGQIDHVRIQSDNNGSERKGSEPLDTLSQDEQQQNVNLHSNEDYSEVNAEAHVKDHRDYIDKQEADKNTEVTGDYWRYSRMEDYFYGVSIGNAEEKQSSFDSDHRLYEIETNPTAEGTATRLYRFQSDLVAEGQEFIKQLRASNAHPDAKINVVVLGDLTENFTRIVFPSIAAILQKEKGRILPHHIHQGMEVIGMLYIPSDINTREVSVRRSMQRTLNEIDVQHIVNDIRGYDHMMFYQDVQNRTECTYPILDDEQLAEYLIQCLVHLYLACNDSHPLLSGTSSADVFYFSMGATSVFFDTENEDRKGRHKIAQEFIKNFKSDGDDEKEHQEFQILNENEYSPISFVTDAALGKLEIDLVDEKPSPHPVKDFMAKYLKRYYYNLFLRFFTENMLHRTISQIDNATRASLESISTESKRRFSDAQKNIFSNLRDIVSRISANDGGIPCIIRIFREMQDKISRKKEEIQGMLNQNFWRNIEENYLPKKLLDKFTEYHDAYVADIKNKTGGTQQIEQKKQAVTDLNGILSNEATMLSRICRSVLLGVVLALAFVPVLSMLSPRIVNLGNVEENRGWWYLGIFFIPTLFQFIGYWRYTRKKVRAANNLKAMYLHDAYARVANRIESEINSFYDKMIALGDKYVTRCEDIRKELGLNFTEPDHGKPLFPESLFNQPLISGKFGNHTLLPKDEADDAEMRINYIRYKLSELTKVEYFLFINQQHDIIMDLFRDISLCENLIRRVKDNGEEELVTMEQQENELRVAWEKHRDDFEENLRVAIIDSLLPRENSTVGEKLHHYCSSAPDNVDVLKPMIAYAATNGEITSSADMEFTDAKMNDKRVERCIIPFISSPCIQMQVDQYNNVYSKYVFVTRWRCFEHCNLNRLLPMEDFDEKIRIQRVYEEEIKAQAKGKKKHRSMDEEKIQKEHSEGAVYTPKISSLLLWALCPDGSSSEWFRLFDSEFFAEAFEDKNTYRRVLNQND